MGIDFSSLFTSGSFNKKIFPKYVTDLPSNNQLHLVEVVGLHERACCLPGT